MIAFDATYFYLGVAERIMGYRVLLCMVAAIAAFGWPVESQAADGGRPAYRSKSYRSAYRHHRFYRNYDGSYGYVGGYRNFEENTPFTFSSANNYPGHYNNQTFWERVQTQRNYPVQY
jgi:hypothetical protein